MTTKGKTMWYWMLCWKRLPKTLEDTSQLLHTFLQKNYNEIVGNDVKENINMTYTNKDPLCNIYEYIRGFGLLYWCHYLRITQIINTLIVHVNHKGKNHGILNALLKETITDSWVLRTPLGCCHLQCCLANRMINLIAYSL